MRNRPIPVFVCDPQPAVLYGLTGILENADEIELVGSASTTAECLTHADEQESVIYIVDQLPGNVFAPEFIRSLIAGNPTRRVVVYSAHDRVSMIASAYSAGASAFVSKLDDTQALLDVIVTVASLDHPRDRHYPGRLAVALADYYSSGGGAAASPRRLLTKRQLEIYLLVADGHSADAIAAQLDMNPRTVSNQLGIIRRKLDIPREHFRSYAIEYGLVDPDRGDGTSGPPRPRGN